ncbi:MAG: hypothetical protein EXQ82_07295 [Pseudolabrys sp.]|nr:hypothetical protein [Pseudolabrys sp.]
MRKISVATVAMILAVALYFTMFWGFDALRVLTSPAYGLEDVWRSQYVFGIGRVFGLGPVGLIQLAPSSEPSSSPSPASASCTSSNVSTTSPAASRFRKRWKAGSFWWR